MLNDYGFVISQFKSDQLKELNYHEMSHASDFVKAGGAWYNSFVGAELGEILIHPSPTDKFNPYGTGLTSNSPIIALGEGWAYHMGHYLADQRYGINASCTNEGQQYSYCPDVNGTPTPHPHIDVLENYVAAYTPDPFHWIPKGLMYDLIDNGEPTAFTNVNDLVSGYTIAQLFAALQSDVTTVAQYKARLLQQNPGNPTNSNLNALFTSYGF